MSMLTFFKIDPERYGRELDRFLWKRPGTDQHVIVLDRYCTNPVCDCADVCLTLHDLPPGLVTPSPDEPSAEEDVTVALDESPLLRGKWRFDTATGELLDAPDAPASTADATGEMREFLERAAEILIDRKQFVGKWRDENWFYFEDCDDFEDAASCSWRKLFPKEPPWTLRVDDVEYEIDDTYCIVPGCRCRSMILDFDRRGERRRRPVASLELRLSKGGRPRLERVLEGRQSLGERLFDTFLEQADSRLAKLESRRRLVRSFGQSLHRRRNEPERELETVAKTWMQRIGGTGELPAPPARAAAPPERSRRSVARNDPCPCGSGRKYKNCCGRR